MTARPPARPSRAGHAAYRRRLRTGGIVARIEVDASIVDFLVRLHWLREGDACDRTKIGAAIARLLEDAVR